MKLSILVIVALSSCMCLFTDSNAVPPSAPLPKPPSSILGIGNSTCSEFVSTYNSMQRVRNNEIKDAGEIAGVFGAYGDFTGTFGGFLAHYMMTNGDTKVPTKNPDEAMSLLYQICKQSQNQNIRYIDAVWLMSHSFFGRDIRDGG